MNIILYLPFLAAGIALTFFIHFGIYLIHTRKDKIQVLHLVILFFLCIIYNVLKGVIYLTTNPWLLYRIAVSILVLYSYVLLRFIIIANNLKIKCINCLGIFIGVIIGLLLFTPLIYKTTIYTFKNTYLNITYNLVDKGIFYVFSTLSSKGIMFIFLFKVIFNKNKNKKSAFILTISLISIIMLVVGFANDLMIDYLHVKSMFVLEYVTLIIAVIYSYIFMVAFLKEEKKSAYLAQELKNEQDLEYLILENNVELDKAKQELKKLNEITKEISGSPEFESVLHRIYSYLMQTYRFEGFGIILLDDEKKHFIVDKFFLPDDLYVLIKEAIGIKFPLVDDKGIVSECLINKRMVYWPEVVNENITDTAHTVFYNLFHHKSVMALPIIIGDEMFGCFMCGSFEYNVYLNYDQMCSIERFVNQVALIIRNSKLYEEVLDKSNKLEIALEKAEEANQLKTEFLGIISHELRTPMTGILGFTQLLMSRKVKKEDEGEYLGRIHRLGKKLLNILNDLLDLSVIEAGKFEIEYEYCDIREIIDDTYIIFKDVLEKKDISFTTFINAPTNIYSDPKRLRQILLNIIGNAVKFTDQGAISVTVKEENENYVFLIEDTGIGISEEAQNKIFDMFSREQKYTQSKYKGTGLGLGICSKLLKALNGSIWVESQQDKGSQFGFFIPIIKDPKELEVDKGFSSDENIYEIMSNSKVIFADDDDDAYKLIEDILLEQKCNVVKGFTSGLPLLEELKCNNDYHLVILDIQMEELNGFELIKKIKEINPSIPVIACSAFAMKDEIEKYEKHGFIDYIVKPIHIDDFILKISNCLHNN